MKPTISVIVPVYNAEKYLNDCIESIIDQTFTNWELILVNDGSSDSSGNICTEYTQKDKRISVIHKNNGGVSTARNVGLDAAIGKYTVFIDSDDEVEPEYFQTLLIEGEKGADLVIQGIISERSGERKLVLFSKEADIDESSPVDFSILKQRGVYCKLYKTEIIKANNLCFPTNVHMGEDAIFTTKYLLYCKKISVQSLAHYVYREDVPGSLMHSKHNAFPLLQFHEEYHRNINILNQQRGVKDRWALTITPTDVKSIIYAAIHHSHLTYDDFCKLLSKIKKSEHLQIKRMVCRKALETVFKLILLYSPPLLIWFAFKLKK